MQGSRKKIKAVCCVGCLLPSRLVWNASKMLGSKLENRSSAELVPGSGLAPRTPVICFRMQSSANPPLWSLSEHPTALLTSL